jgi:integrase
MRNRPLQPELPLQRSTPTKSFAEALSAVENWTDLDEVRRRDLSSALRSVGRMLNTPLAAIPCDVAWLNERLFKQSPATFGISLGRFRNISSGLRAVLRRLGAHSPDRRSRHDLPAAWKTMMEAVANDGQRAALAALARYCAAAGVAPAEVTDATLAAFVAAERTTRLSSATKHRGRNIAAAWNYCVRARLPGWPSQQLAAARVREPYALRLETAHESFQKEVEAFKARRGGKEGRFLVGRGSHRLLQQVSIDARVFAIQQAAGILVRLGVPVQELRGLRDLVHPTDRPAKVLNWLAERQAKSTGMTTPEGGQLAMVAETLRQIAVHDVAIEPEAATQLTDWVRQTRPRRRNQGLTRKNRDRLRALVPLQRRGLLLHLPAELMRRARVLGAGSAEAGRTARLAAALELLLVCPLRRRSMLALRLDAHLQRLDPRSRRITHLVLQPDDMKNALPMEWPLPPESSKLVEEYISAFRPALAAPDNPWVFPSGLGAQGESSFSRGIENIIAKEVGADVNVHLVRHFAAWIYLKRHPGAYEDVRRVLGHRTIETTIGSYVAFEAAMAAERFDAVVLEERRATRAVAAAKWGKPRTRPSGRSKA